MAADPLGQSALLVYGVHLFVIMLTTLAGPQLFGDRTFTAAQNTALQAGGSLLIWLVVTLRPRIVALVSAGFYARPRPALAQASVSRQGRRG